LISYKINITISEEFKQFISNKRDDFSYAFRKGYKKYKTLSIIELEKYIKQNFDLNDIESRGVISKIKSRFDSTSLNKDEKCARIVNISKQINDLKSEKIKYKIRNKFKLTKKLSKLDKNLSHDIVFGTKYLLQKISYLSNCKKDEDIYKLIKSYKQQYQEHRKQEIYLIGEANQKGNRFFDFDFISKQLIYKPNIKTKIAIKLNLNDSMYYKNLLKLQKMIDTKDISVTIGLTEDYITIIFDEEILSGYSIDIKERKKDIQTIKNKKLNKEYEAIQIKEIYQKYYKEQENNMMKDKLSNRILAFDSNPNYIGYSIIDNSTEIKVIHTGYYDLLEINKKLPKNATNNQKRHVNNKRKHEICHIWKDIFATAFHYKVGNFGMEDLNFKQKEIKESKEFNRQTKNIWYRTLSEQLINKHTKDIGIKKIECNPIYTSFIGNLNYNFVDPINSSIEIGRRCINKYTKNNIFYPNFHIDTIIHTMSRLNDIKSRDVEIIKGSENWKVLYKNIKKSGLRYRVSLKDIELLHEIKYHKSNKLLHRNVNKIMFN